MGGVTRLPRLCGTVGEYGGGPVEYWYDERPQSLPCVEFGESGPEWPFIVWMYVPASRTLRSGVLARGVGDLSMKGCGWN